MVVAGCKAVISRRLKKSGMHWTEAGAEDIPAGFSNPVGIGDAPPLARRERSVNAASAYGGRSTLGPAPSAPR
ncbi:hypothetical protein LBMAG56_17690 [Verrucomicrobiota bacterium]|nr:hypothetical protein LBMAG56_17690 [Verrucomicrobiota bacterium]